MKLVIDKDELLENMLIVIGSICDFDSNTMLEMANSVLDDINVEILPKGHGRLIDADAFEQRCMFDSDIEDMQDVIYAIRDFKPIIEADKERSE